MCFESPINTGEARPGVGLRRVPHSVFHVLVGGRHRAPRVGVQTERGRGKMYIMRVPMK